jgi:uncharacterized damage-inducible protein DinB
MIAPSYAQTMAAYNTEMNRRIYAAAGRLSDAQRREQRGAFWGSIHGTLSHLLWGDMIWMSRFAGWRKPAVPLKQSADMIGDFDELAAARVQADADISAWAATLTQAWLDAELTWFSGATQREVRKPCGLAVVHLFNHQTHHRGQVHCLLTMCGEATGDTDLPFILPV